MPTREELHELWNEAVKLVAEGKYPEALQKYQFFFDHSRGVSGLGGVRSSYILHEIIEMGEQYPAARQALVEHRNRFAEQLLDGSRDQDAIDDMISINRYLDQQDHSLAIYDQLRTTGQASPDILSTTSRSLWELFTQEHRYEDLREHIGGIVKRILQHIAEHQINLDLADDIPIEEQYQEYLASSVQRHGPLAYEILLGLRKDMLASKLAERLLAFDSSEEIRQTLNEHEVRARDANNPL